MKQLWRKRTVRPGGKPKHHLRRILAGLFVALAGVGTVGVGTASAVPAPARWCPAGTTEAVAVLDSIAHNSYTVVSAAGLSTFSVTYHYNSGNPIDEVIAVAPAWRQIVAYKIHTQSGDTVSNVGDVDVPRQDLDSIVPIFRPALDYKVRTVQICTQPKGI